MTPDRCEAAAVECLALADALDASTATTGLRAHVAGCVVHVPLVHPMRGYDDRVLTMARGIERGEATADDLRAFVAELRAVVPAMRATGWWRIMFGGS